MKRTALAGLFITAAMLASPAFAADKDLCDLNLQKLEDSIATLPATSENTTNNIKTMQARAQAAKKAGNDKKCVDETTQALQRIQKISSGNQG
ncbi:hypothetical protein [Pseudomonas purpurea]|uniref:hypothetical protein n=1 Tax=Pseudomonas purpurea TaxID=3136737 RepID=UPI00326679B0